MKQVSLYFFSVNRIEQNSQQPNSRLQINPKEEGTVVELTQFETGNDKLLPELGSIVNTDTPKTSGRRMDPSLRR